MIFKIDTDKKTHCPHCGRHIEKDAPRSLGHHARSKGWTEELVNQASTESGIEVYCGPTTCGNDPEQFVCLWTRDERDMGPFFHKAVELGAEMTGITA